MFLSRTGRCRQCERCRVSMSVPMCATANRERRGVSVGNRGSKQSSELVSRTLKERTCVANTPSDLPRVVPICTTSSTSWDTRLWPRPRNTMHSSLLDVLRSESFAYSKVGGKHSSGSLLDPSGNKAGTRAAYDCRKKD